jgi:hypothetical protein
LEIQEPEPLDPVDLAAELHCRGRLPRDKDFAAVESERRAA